MQILVLYYQQYERGIRSTVQEHLYSFRRYSEEQFYYLNVAGGIPAYLAKIRFDLVIYHYTMCACRFQPGFFDTIETRWQRLIGIEGYKVAIAQDEQINTNGLCRFFKRFGIKTVFTCLPEHEWQKVYPTEKSGVSDFVTVLTGYVDERSIPLVHSLAASERCIDVGYRARKNSYSLGRHGTIKWRIADFFNSLDDRLGLRFDISTDPSDVFYGDDWYRFLCRCRTVLGCEGGASLHDPDGDIERSVSGYLANKPDASFEEVEKACFPELDGNLELFALSPRHFEACVTKTCQILVEGDYNGIFLPGVHYISLNKDFSNINEVLSKICDHQYCAQLAENAYNDIVLSGKYTYKYFVDTVLAYAQPKTATDYTTATEHRYLYRLHCRERFQWLFLTPSFCIALLRKPVRSFLGLIGCSEVYFTLKRLIKR